jgi:hypothetical protein
VTEQQLLRMAKGRLAILRHAEEITGNVALTCRSYGIRGAVRWRAIAPGIGIAAWWSRACFSDGVLVW